MKPLLPIWLLALPLSLLMAGAVWANLPCKTHEEALAEAVVGYFLVQQVAAGRCDEELGGKAFAALHSRLETRFEKQVGQARSVRAKFFQRAYGESGVQELDRVNTLMIDLFNSTVSATAENCGKLKAELDRRLTVAWSEIQERLERRVASIAPTDKGICKE